MKLAGVDDDQRSLLKVYQEMAQVMKKNEVHHQCYQWETDGQVQEDNSVGLVSEITFTKKEMVDMAEEGHSHTLEMSS